ncbi:LacI family DNA-binding transcriptional regulator [Collinsella tanakaei]|uniref:LacI family DNA-binding transcriptional regulator n=1 Tax=Collinsella tanakaei TaxID=626935 RepID=UPI00195DD835|nr:LacI family DNA-binding transcriptional regulator [Collinsella tanakaei]MBM6756825.1 LacI family DNA-binding transcriptional regulator [Collinsella tanakaei]
MARMRIRDIADQAGVSPATVSRYLNNRPGQMTEATRARIAEVIERTGYRPRSAARNLRLDNSHLIGIILADSENPYSSAVLDALSSAAARRGYSIMASFSGNDPEREREAIDRLVDMGAEALVVNTCGEADGDVECAAARVPLVLLDRDTASGTLDLVTSDNEALMGGLLDEVERAGCTWCGLLTEDAGESPVRRARAEAFARGLARRGVAGAVLPLADDAARAADDLLAFVPEDADPAGIIAINGLVFLRLVAALESCPEAVRRRLRLATFDDYPWNRAVYGGVTTAAQDTAAIAQAVLDRVVKRLSDAGEAPQALPALRVELAGEIHRRASTVPVR